MLRVASANAISMAKLRQLAGMGDNETFGAHHESALLSLVSAVASHSVNLLPSGARRGVGGISCYGHQFRLRSMLRGRRPQACLACIRDFGFCRANWDLSASILCLLHRCPLEDQCPSCGSRLRWNRPAVEWGHCQHFLGREADMRNMPATLFIAQQITDDLFRGDEPDFSPLGLSCPGISLDAWISLLWALGALKTPSATPRRGTFISSPNAVDARELVIRATARIPQFLTGEMGFGRLADEVAEAPLVGTILNPVGRNDRALALGWYAAIYGKRHADALLRRHRGIAQMSLF